MPEKIALSPLNMVFVNLSHVTCTNSCDSLELEGEPDRGLLRQALNACASRRLAMRSRVKRFFLRFMLVETDAAPEVPLQVIARPGEGTLDALLPDMLAQVWSRPLDLAHAPPLRAVLWVCAGRSFLQLICSHVWSDAQAGYQLTRDLADTYQALAAARTCPPGPELGVAAAPPSAGLRWWQRLRYLASAACEIAGDMLHQDLLWPVKPVPRGPTGMDKRAMPDAWLQRLKLAAKAQGASVHALLLTALVRASADAAGRAGVFRYTDSYSLRPAYGAGSERLYDALMVPYNLRLDSRRSDRQLLADIADRISGLRAGGVMVDYYRQVIFDVCSRFLPRRLATLWAGRAIAKSNILISNPGPIPFALDSFGPHRVADYFSYPQLFPPGRALLLFSTFRNVPRLIVMFDTHAFPEGIEQGLIAPYLRQLDRLLDRLGSHALPTMRSGAMAMDAV
ncbi:MAG: hypothetical protein V4633_24460 [Pseudomonadota bacterium]